MGGDRAIFVVAHIHGQAIDPGRTARPCSRSAGGKGADDSASLHRGWRLRRRRGQGRQCYQGGRALRQRLLPRLRVEGRADQGDQGILRLCTDGKSAGKVSRRKKAGRGLRISAVIIGYDKRELRCAIWHTGESRGIILDQATLVLRCPNMKLRASSSISALNANLSFSAIARAAAGRAETSSCRRFTLGYFANTSSPRT